ncbi:hypothetical protein DFO66_102324 [Brevibacterium sanguinis]|uniref:Uncharacterized protein n=2 Tax=Brevibacterium TaxID=1696 RepID=A0A366IQ96_9MICO|nr:MULTISPECIES: hypothetical protein [Brevibacterium]RBP67268.1 hypothetical protein DFO66_102324 [Brevibacterium sanguinis]RBP73793.1 hypothetical protein DFO65_102324 [Brevibacterium celere]
MAEITDTERFGADEGAIRAELGVIATEWEQQGRVEPVVDPDTGELHPDAEQELLNRL